MIFSVASSNCVDYAVWTHPIALSGTCAEVTHDGLCTRINVWHVYKGKGLIPPSVMTTQIVNNFDTSVIYKLNAENLRKRFRLHQTRILYGSISDGVFVLEPQGARFKNCIIPIFRDGSRDLLNLLLIIHVCASFVLKRIHSQQRVPKQLGARGQHRSNTIVQSEFDDGRIERPWNRH